MNDKNKLYERYITIFENTGAGTILIDEDTTIVMVNNRFASMLGYDKSEIEGKLSWTEFIHPEDVDRMREYHYLRRRSPDAAPKNYEFRIFSREGQLLYIYLTIDMIPGTGLSVASLADITSLVETREALRASEEKYRMLVETMNDGLLIQNEHLIIEYVNSRFCEILGYRQDEVIGKKIEEFLISDFKAHFNLQMQKRAQGIQEGYELAWQKKDGKICYTIVSPRIISDKNKPFAGSFAVITDITERKEWEIALKKSEELFASVFDVTPVAIALVDMDTGEIVKSNKLFRSMANISNDTIKHFLFDLGIVKKDDFRKLYKQLLKSKKISDYEIYLNYNEKECIAILSAELIQFYDKNMVIITLTDITEKRILEKELMSISENERRNIGQDLHDDIIPHLLGINVMIQALIQQLQKKKRISVLELEEIRNLLSIAVVKVRQLSKGLSPAFFISNQGLSILLEELCSFTQSVYGIPCIYEQEGIIHINDPGVLTHIYYIIQGALHNAVRHSSATKIKVTVTADNEYARIIIDDNGKGFDKETTQGMGLKIMMHRASSIGADLFIDSDRGFGTKIILQLINKGDNEVA